MGQIPKNLGHIPKDLDHIAKKMGHPKNTKKYLGILINMFIIVYIVKFYYYATCSSSE